MLSTRIVTAAVLFALLLPALFLAPPWVWGAFTLVFCAAAAAEWARLVGAPARSALLVAAFGVAYLFWRDSAARGAVAATAILLCGGSAMFWATFALQRLAAPAVPEGRARRGGTPLGFALVVAAWVASVELRHLGIAAMLSVAMVVWIADIAAYFGGRAFGRRKLAPRISPGKTWAGAVSAVVAVAAASIAAVLMPVGGSTSADGLLDAALPAVLAGRIGWVGMLAVVGVLTALSIIGDLYESLLKREAGVKDSGRTLPGHGGVLDRIDALLPVLPVGFLAMRALGAGVGVAG